MGSEPGCEAGVLTRTRLVNLIHHPAPTLSRHSLPTNQSPGATDASGSELGRSPRGPINAGVHVCKLGRHRQEAGNHGVD